jgi:hypothetical protein
MGGIQYDGRLGVRFFEDTSGAQISQMSGKCDRHM